MPSLDTPNDALALILFLMVVPLFTFFLSPLMAQLSRKHEFEADAYAVAQTSGADLASALLKLYKDNASTLTPDPVVIRSIRRDRGVAGAAQREPPVRSGTHADIVVPLPVDQIVPRPAGGATRMIGDLVGLKPHRLQHGLGGVVEIGRDVLDGRGKHAPADRPVKGRAGLDGQLVGRDMLRAQSDRSQSVGRRHTGVGQVRM
eukprot:gene67304-92196_t